MEANVGDKKSCEALLFCTLKHRLPITVMAAIEPAQFIDAWSIENYYGLSEFRDLVML